MIANSATRRLHFRFTARSALLVATLCLRAAQAESESSERAQQLFDEARALMKDGNYAEACPKLAESQKLDPGGGTILNLGICLRQQGRNVEAWNALTQALAQARRDGRADREKTAEKQLAALSTGVSRWVLRLAPADSPEPVTVTIDGVPLTVEQLGSPLPLEPGSHEVRASAAHHQSWSVQIRVEASAGEQQLTIPALEPEVRVQPPPVVAPPPTAAAVVAPAADAAGGPRTNRADHGLRPEVYAAFGVGALALGVGTYFGVRSLSLKSDSNRHWDGQYCTAPSCVDDWDRAQTSARVCDISVGVGLLALGVGTYFLLQPSRRESAAPAPTRLQVRASQTGAFVSTTTDF